MYGRQPLTGMGPCPPRVVLALRTQGNGFYTVQGGIDPDTSPFYSPV